MSKKEESPFAFLARMPRLGGCDQRAVTLPMLILLLPVSVAHVPAFETSYGCLVRPHVDDTQTSQATYFKTPPGAIAGVMMDSGALALRDSLLSNDGLVLQVTTRIAHHSEDLSVFAGCLPSSMWGSRVCPIDMPLGNPNQTSVQYKEPEVEPFTQSVYHMLADRSLRADDGDCDATSGVYAIMLKNEGAATIRWTAVVGKSEKFTLGQLISFPWYVARVHGSFGNDRYRLHVLVILVVIVATSISLAVRASTPMTHDEDASPTRRWTIRLSMLAALAFMTAGVDQLLHYVDSTHECTSSDSGYSAPMFFGLVLGLAQCLPLVLALYLGGKFRGDWNANWYGILLGLFILVTTATSIAVLGDLAGIIFVVGVIAVGAAHMSSVLASRGRRQAWKANLSTSVCACVGVLLLPFMAAGYWVGPILLTAASLFSVQ